MNSSCNLECLKDKVGDDVLEFVGPVKIVLVDTPKSVYCVNIFKAAAILMAQIMLGITTMTVLFYSTRYKREDIFKGLHVLLCTVGIQMFMPFGILSVNGLNGSAVPMKASHRRLEHILLQISGYVCLVGGIFVTFLSGYSPFVTAHSCLGLAVSVLIFFTAISGIGFSCFKCNIYLENLSKVRRFIYATHKIFGIITFIISSSCFISALMKDTFVNWLPFSEMYYFCITFSIFYTFVIVIC